MAADPVLIAGAGPVGLMLAALLHQAGIAVRVFEKRAGLNTASRASTFHPPTLALLDRLGLLAPLFDRGVRVDRIAFLTAGQGADATLDLGLLPHAHPYRWHFEQAQATPALLALLPGLVHFGAEVVGAAQGASGVTLALADGSRARGRLAIAADGAHSRLREAAGIAVERGAYGHRVLRLVTRLQLEAHVPGLAGAGVAYVFDGAASVSLLKMPGVWRVILRVPPETTDAAALAADFRAPLLQKFLPDLPPLPVETADVYGVAKGIAATMRAGRVLVVGDAAHVTNTRGGMNMNAGLHDAATLAATIIAEASLEAWAAARMRVTREHLLERTDRAVASAGLWRDEALAAARAPATARAWLASAAMLDTAEQGMPR